MRASRLIGVGVVVLSAAIGLAFHAGQLQADPRKAPKVPKFEIDTTWPKPYKLSAASHCPGRRAGATAATSANTAAMKPAAVSNASVAAVPISG